MSKREKDDFTLPEGIKDPYHELDFDLASGGSSLTPAVIKKRYRELALKYHPDKNQGDAAAAAEMRFMRVKAAYEFLSNETERGKFDKAREKKRAAEEARAQQVRAMTSKRRALTAKLEEDEKRARKRQAGPSAHAHADEHQPQQSMSKAQKDRLRREGMEMRESRTREESKRGAAFAAATASAAAAAAETSGTEGRQIKVKWRRQKLSHSDDSLAGEFRRFGHVEQVAMTGDKGNAAVLTFETSAAAKAARDAFASSAAGPAVARGARPEPGSH